MYATLARGRAVMVISIICLIAGCALAIVGLSSSSTASAYNQTAASRAVSSVILFIMAGLPLVIPGIIGTIAGAKRNFGLHVAYLVLVIISLIWVMVIAIIMAIACATLAALQAALESDSVESLGALANHPELLLQINRQQLATAVAVSAVVTTAMFILWALELAGSIITCVSLCADDPQTYNQGTTMVVSTGYYPVNAGTPGYDEPVPQVITPVPGYKA